MCVTNLGSYMTLTFLGYYDQKVKISSSEKAKLELLLVKLCHKKRKESVSPVVQVSQGEKIKSCFGSDVELLCLQAPVKFQSIPQSRTLPTRRRP